MDKKDVNFKKLPDNPGVYFFLGRNKQILYIGKATSLRNRVRSYFTNDIKEKRSELIQNMVAEAKEVSVTETDSVLEALILETNLIRSHKPSFNTRSKDDKSYNHLIITNEEWPRVLVIRGKDLTEKYLEDEIMYHFGPFPSGQLFREALRIIRRIFKFYDTKEPVGSETTKLAKGKISFNRQIGLYPGKQSKEEYMETIRHIRLFFEGRKKELLAELEEKMMEAAKREEFEEAARCKRQIYALTHINDIALIKDESRIYRDEKRIRIEAYDIAHLAGQEMVGVMTVVEGGEAKNNEYRKFKINSVDGPNDPAALKEVLERRLKHSEWPFPQIIVVDGNAVQKRAAEWALKKYQQVIPVVAVVKNKQHKPDRLIGQSNLLRDHKEAILLSNAEAHRFAINFHRERNRKRQLS